MSSPTAAEADAVATPAKPRTRRAPAAKPETTGKWVASAKTSLPEPKQALPAPPTNRLRLAGGLCAAAIATVAFVYLLVGGDTEQPAAIANDVPTVVSAGELAGFARASGIDVYWAGAGGRQLELTTTPSGTFVRYRRAVAAASSLTVGTYPLEDAYATAVGRSRTEGMTSRQDRRRRHRGVEPRAADECVPRVARLAVARRGLRADGGRGANGGPLGTRSSRPWLRTSPGR